MVPFSLGFPLLESSNTDGFHPFPSQLITKISIQSKTARTYLTAISNQMNLSLVKIEISKFIIKLSSDPLLSTYMFNIYVMFICIFLHVGRPSCSCICQVSSMWISQNLQEVHGSLVMGWELYFFPFLFILGFPHYTFFFFNILTPHLFCILAMVTKRSIYSR